MYKNSQYYIKLKKNVDVNLQQWSLCDSIRVLDRECCRIIRLLDFVMKIKIHLTLLHIIIITYRKWTMDTYYTS